MDTQESKLGLVLMDAILPFWHVFLSFALDMDILDPFI